MTRLRYTFPSGPGTVKERRGISLQATMELTKPRVVDEGGFKMRRPPSREMRFPQRKRKLRKNFAQEELEAAAKAVKYAPSNYHCKIDGKLARRVRPATPCPRDFTLQQAGDALRKAIRAGRVCDRWIEGFPKLVWHREGNIWYEARTELGNLGTYHAYPVEDSSVPAELRR